MALSGGAAQGPPQAEQASNRAGFAGNGSKSGIPEQEWWQGVTLCCWSPLAAGAEVSPSLQVTPVPPTHFCQI